MSTVNERVRAILAPYSGDRELSEDADLREAGLDSVDVLEFFAELESSFGIRFAEGDLDLANLNTIGAITRLVENRLV